MSAVLNRKGQITLPKTVRDLLGLELGSAVDFKVTDEGQVLLSPTQPARPASRFAALRGIATVKMSTDEIMALTRHDD